MKKPDTFPYEYKANGMVFQVYLAPQFRKEKDGTKSRYDSFLVYYYQSGKRVPKRCSTWEDVETYIDDVVSAFRKNDPERLELSGRDRRIYLAAVEAAKPLGREVDDLVREHVTATRVLAPHGVDLPKGAQILEEALKRLEGVPMSTAVDFYKRHGATMTATRTVPEVVKELLKGLAKDSRGKYHIRDMRLRLGRFAAAFPGPIHHLQERDVTGWLQDLKKTVWKKGEEKPEPDGKTTKVKAKRIENPEGAPVGGRTRNNYRDAINELFEFAKRRGYIPRDLPTAAEDTDRVPVVAGKNHIISPEEAKCALKNLSPHLIPFTVLKLFSGLRTEEAYGLRWDELRFRSNAVIIEAKLAKLRQRRVPPILPNLAKWLRPFQKLKGPINPGYSSPQAVMKAVSRESKKVNVILSRNTFRNCYISYRVAQPQPSAIVAAEAGTSVRMIESNYKALADEEEAKRWFSLTPTRSQLSELEVYVNNLSCPAAK
jgi:integrase